MRSATARLFTVLLAGASVACEEGGVTLPPDSPACNANTAVVTIASAPGSYNAAGTLTAASCKLGRGSFADRYELNLGVNANVDIVVSSTDFDAFLVLRDAGDNGITSDDDFGPGSDARLNFAFAAGKYYILATTYEDDIVGDYTVTITVSSP